MGQKTSLLAVGLIIFAIILTILFIVTRVVGNFGSSSSDTKDEANIETTSENFVPVSKLITTPSVYAGYTLSTNSKIKGWTTNKSFYFVEEDQGIFGDSVEGTLLVISENPAQLPAESGDDRLGLGEIAEVTVYGKQYVLNREELQEALDVNLEDPKIRLGNPVLNDWELGPVIIMNKYEITSDEE